MTLVVSEIYCAFKEANVSNETARRADEAIQALAGKHYQQQIKWQPWTALAAASAAGAGFMGAVIALIGLVLHLSGRL